MSRSFSIVLFSFMALAQAAALVKHNANEVVAVAFTMPNEHTIWDVASTQPVKWVPPASRYNHSATANISLGFLDEGIERLCATKPLATNVPIIAGEVLITVPNVPHRNNYIVDCASFQPFSLPPSPQNLPAPAGIRKCWDKLT
ncbi:hypothetical protein BGW80DRAFT_1248306 [Lactifluus volemus]|nr:hypothetical protein BGW80DRAFT_1248306 [Lactifluus volemus]